MMRRANGFAELDSCRYLDLRELREPHENGLRLLIQEADASPIEETLKIDEIELKGSRAIKATKTSRTFELLWQRYVAYSVRNESFTGGASADEAFSGRLIRFYTKSYFFDYVEKATFACTDFPGPLTHICLVCLNHVVDVIAVDLPTITVLAE
jgi:hypothetical protein